MRFARRFFSLYALGALIFLGPVFFGCSAAERSDFHVSAVIDGDTVELAGGKPLRYIGIDTPETRRRQGSDWVVVQEPFSQEAKDFNASLVADKDVRLEFDVQKEDKYQRLLAYCFVQTQKGEVMVQEEILRRGLAYLYTFSPNVRYVDRFRAAQEEAKKNRLNLWSVQTEEIDSKDAKKHLGSRKRVKGIVKSIYSTPKTWRLELDGMVAVIFKKDAAFFSRASLDPERDYKGKSVRIFGSLKEYRGRPEIILSGPDQIEILSGGT